LSLRNAMCIGSTVKTQACPCALLTVQKRTERPEYGLYKTSQRLDHQYRERRRLMVTSRSTSPEIHMVGWISSGKISDIPSPAPKHRLYFRRCSIPTTERMRRTYCSIDQFAKSLLIRIDQSVVAGICDCGGVPKCALK
jgi:hypothetical protein